jgi:transcriptional regulator with GAF, ATPase, and Fis domain
MDDAICDTIVTRHTDTHEARHTNRAPALPRACDVRGAPPESEGDDADLLHVVDPSPCSVSSLVGEIARSRASVLILGETGVGKEVLAGTLHALSRRRGVLTRINCAALSESLLESELFGHEKGAFTGAVTRRSGLLEAAEGGTVLLDEIGELSLAIQAKLLRAVEQREVLRLGSTHPVPVDVRFIAATNRDLLAAVEAGAFRRDLFFRLDGVQLVIPPLRERRAMIRPLALQFLDQARAQADKPSLRLGDGAVAALEGHAWPGNVRELKAVIERAVLLCQGDEIVARHLSFSRRAPVTGPPTNDTAPPDHPPPTTAYSVAWLEGARLELTSAELADRDAVLCALEVCAGNQTRAAKRLGISRTTLVSRLLRYRIRRPRG